MDTNKIEKHPFDPFIPQDTKILMMGTFPPTDNRWSMNFYYPNWINDMWRIMGYIFYGEKDKFCDNINKTFCLDAIKDFLNNKHMAMYDTGVEVNRLKGNASDKYLEILTPIDIHNFLNNNESCIALATTGEKAASVIADLTGTALPQIGKCEEFPWKNRMVRHYRMPSTSRAYPLAMSKKADFYSSMFASLGYRLFEK